MRARAGSEGAIALVLAVLVIATAAVFGSDRTSEVDPRCSTWVDDRRGAHALYLLLEHLGLRPERHFDPPSADAATGRTHVLLAPSWPVTKSEAAALLDWTARGGRLVVVDAPSAPPQLTVDVSPVLRPLGLETRPAGGRAHDVTVVPAGWTRETRRVEWPARLVLATRDAGDRDPRAGAPETLVSGPEGELAVRIPFGEGEVVAVADDGLVANESLGRGDNAVLAVRLLDASARPVVFDEFHHGFTPTGPRASLPARIAGLIVETWPGRALLLLTLAGLVHVLGAAVRTGAPLAEPPPSRRAFREHADALGRLLEGARASRDALVVLLDGARRTVGSRIGAGPRATAAELRARLGRSVAPGARELSDAVGEAAEAADRGDVKDVELARLAANLAAARRNFVRGGSER
jgi:hypothetical protein